jgi:hypothetical protein
MLDLMHDYRKGESFRIKGLLDAQIQAGRGVQN